MWCTNLGMSLNYHDKLLAHNLTEFLLVYEEEIRSLRFPLFLYNLLILIICIFILVFALFGLLHHSDNPRMLYVLACWRLGGLYLFVGMLLTAEYVFSSVYSSG